MHRRVLAIALSFVLAVALAPGGAQAVEQAPSPNPTSGDLALQFPSCSWWVETSTQNSNILYPDPQCFDTDEP